MKKLRLEWSFMVGLGAVFLVGGYLLLLSGWEAHPGAPEAALTWLILPTAGLVYLLSVTWKNLATNHRQGETELLTGLGWGNRLTLLRGVLIAGMLGFLVLRPPTGWLAWIPGTLYTLAIAVDFFDGYIARVTGHTTRLGEILDLSFDGLGVLVASMLAVMYGKIPSWYLVIGSARYLFLLGIWLRRRLGEPVYELPQLLSRRLFAGLQAGFLAGVLWPVFTPPGTFIAAALFGLPMAFGFLRDWLYVAGVLRPSGSESETRLGKFYRRSAVLLRVLILQLNLSAIVVWLQNSAEMAPHLALLGLVNLIAVLFLLFGVLPRITSIVALCLLGFFQLFNPLTPGQITLAICYTVILYLGSGALSAWTPDDVLFSRRVGERRSVGVAGEA